MKQEKDGAGVKPAIELVDRQDARELALKRATSLTDARTHI